MFEELVSIKIYHHRNLYYMVTLLLFLLSSTLPVWLLAYSPLVTNLWWSEISPYQNFLKCLFPPAASWKAT